MTTQETRRAVLASVMTEAELQANVMELCRVFGMLAYHTHDARRSPAGFPDLVIVGRRGVLFRELKTDKGRLTPDQVRWIESLQQAGSDADVWRPGHWPDLIRTDLEAVR